MNFSWTPKAEMYEFGRPFPTPQVKLLFEKSAALKRLDAKRKNLQVYEPAAGTGRLTIPLAQLFPNWRILASDKSKAMLSVLEGKKRAGNLENVETRVMDFLDLEKSEKFDLIIISSFLHAVKNWRNALVSLSKHLEQGGLFCLVGDDADLYCWALGRKNTLGGTPDKNLALFWKNYLEARKKAKATGTENSQVGCKWEASNRQIVSVLQKAGFKEVDKTKTTWNQEFTIGGLFKIVEERCYSSMFVVDGKTYGKIEKELGKLCTLPRDKKTISRHNAIARFLEHKHQAN